MNSHSWTIASVPAKSAGPIDRAGLTEVPVAGIATKWIAASVRPIVERRQRGVLVALVGDREDDDHEDGGHARSRAGSAAHQLVAAALVAEGVLAHVALGVEVREALQQHEQQRGAPTRAPASCATTYRPTSFHDIRPPIAAPTETAGLKWRAGDPAEGVGHHHDRDAEGEADRGDRDSSPPAAG